MATPASILLDQASTLLQDTAKVRWPDLEMIDWLNEGINAICAVNPTAYSYPQDLDLVTGIRQTLPENSVILMDIHRNIESGFAVRICDRAIFDSGTPDWPNERESTNIEHYMYDPRTPNVMFVYPPNDGTGKVEATFAGIPPLIVSVTDELPLRAHFNPPLLDYIAYRAYTKDAEFAANSETALAHFNHFANAISTGGNVPSETAPR